MRSATGAIAARTNLDGDEMTRAKQRTPAVKRLKPERSVRPSPAPLRVGSALTLLRQHRPDLPPTARRIRDYIEHHAENVIRMSITELAEQTRSSEGSVVGLCQRMGIKGFQELKILLARDLVEPIRLIHEDLKEGDSAAQVSERIFAAHVASLAETRKLLSIDALEQAAALIRSAARVEVYGIGSSAPVAQDMGYRLLQLGYEVKVLVDSHVQSVSAAMTDRTVAVVTISHSGSTVETVLATRLAHQAGARTIGITRLGKAPLQRHCEVVLHTAANETKYRPEAMSSRVAQLAIVDTLVSCCALSDPKRSVANLELSARVLAEKRF
jgi:RpiR family carbohydrate utilization transcriptional regulator